MSAQPATSKQTPFASQEDRLEVTLDRLRRATDMLEAAMLRREREARSAEALEQELELVTKDRSRLAHELDQVKAKASRLDAAGAEVSCRLDGVMSDLQSILARP